MKSFQIKKWTNLKANWIQKHTIIATIRNCFIWIEFHTNRGKGFFNTWIDIAKNIFYVALGAEVIPELQFLKPYIIWLIPAALIFFVTWSQIMDLIHYQQTQAEYGNKRNYFQEEVRTFIKETREALKNAKK
jgi:hypothetical protein